MNFRLISFMKERSATQPSNDLTGSVMQHKALILTLHFIYNLTRMTVGLFQGL